MDVATQFVRADVWMGLPEPCQSPVHDFMAFAESMFLPQTDEEILMFPEAGITPFQAPTKVAEPQILSESDLPVEESLAFINDLSNQQTESKSRRKAIPSREWERLRPIIEQLYQTQSLDQLQHIMRDEYSLDADLQMYKKRLRKWGIRKYYSWDQKVEVMEQIKDGCKPGMVNGRPVISARLARPVQRQGQKMKLTCRQRHTIPDNRPTSRGSQSSVSFQSSSGSPSTKSPRGQLRRQSWRSSHSTVLTPEGSNSYPSPPNSQYTSSPDISRLCLQQSPQTQRVEQTLLCANQYWQWYFSQTDFERNIYLLANDRCIFSYIHRAARTLSEHPTKAFKLLNQACEDARHILREQPFRLLTAMADVFQLDKWEGYLSIRSELLKYMAALAGQVLGTQHPVVHVLQSFIDPAILRAISPRLIMLGIQICTNLSNSDQTWLLHHKVSVAEDLCDLGEIDQAMTLLNEVSFDKQKLLPEDHSLSIVITDSLAAMAWIQDRDSEAESHWLRVFDLASKHIDPEMSSISATSLGVLYEKRKAWGKSEFYYRQGLVIALQHGSLEDSRVVKPFKRLHQILQQQGKSFEVWQLRQQHADLCQHWNL